MVFGKKKPEHILSKEELEEYKTLKEKANSDKPIKEETAVDSKGIQHKETDKNTEEQFIEDLFNLVQKYSDDLKAIEIYGYLIYYANIIISSNE